MRRRINKLHISLLEIWQIKRYLTLFLHVSCNGHDEQPLSRLNERTVDMPARMTRTDRSAIMIMVAAFIS